MKLKNKKKNILIISLVIFVLFILAFILFKYIFFNKYEYTSFEEKINIYGLDSIYNNGSNTPNQKVTKIEAIKLVICATNNTININTLVSNYEGENIEEKVLNYAYKNGIVREDEVNKKNYSKKAKIIDLITYISNAKYYMLKKDNDSIDTINISDYNKYKEDEKKHILNLLSDNIIDNNSKYKLNAYRKLNKSICNEMIVKYIEKYNLLSVFDKEIVTNKENLPANYSEYPYIVSDVSKEIYEQKNIIVNEKEYLNPSEFYKYRREYYNNTISNAENYYNTILNISYETISYDDLYNKLNSLVVAGINEEVLKNYVEYVKANKIVISGDSKAQIPCIYNDGTSCRIRMKLNFEIKNSATKENVLYMDNYSNKIKLYDKNKYTLYFDAKMGYVFGSQNVLVSQNDIHSMLLDISKNEINVK